MYRENDLPAYRKREVQSAQIMYSVVFILFTLAALAFNTHLFPKTCFNSNIIILVLALILGGGGLLLGFMIKKSYKP